MNTDTDSDVVACAACETLNAADCLYCVGCGALLKPQGDASAPESPMVSEQTEESPESWDTSSAGSISNRALLRLTLLASAGLLLVLAVLIALVGSALYALPSAALAVLLFATSMGSMSRRSFQLYFRDLQEIFGNAPPGDMSPSVIAEPSTPVQDQDSPSVATVQVNPAAASSAVMTATADPSPPATPTVVAAPAVDVDSENKLNADVGSVFGMREGDLGFLGVVIGLLLLTLSMYLFSKGPPNALAWLSYVLSVVLTLGAVYAIDGRWSALILRFLRGESASFEYRAMLPWAALGGILVFALIIRLYSLDTIPAGLWFDEADNISQAKHIVDNPSSLTVFNAPTALPSIFLLPIAFIIKLVGVSLTAGRLVAVGFGLAGIVAVFLMVRQMSGTSLGLIAAFLTSVMRWDINWSRIGMHGITVPLFTALTAWLTYRAVQNNRSADFALAGAALGMGMWFYSPFRLFPVVIGFVLLHALVFGKRARRRLLMNIGVMAALSIIVALPLVQFAWLESEDFFRRTAATSIFTHSPEGEELGAVIDNLGRHVRMFHIEGDPNGRHNIPGAPMLDGLSGLLMLGGLAVAVFYWRKASFVALPVWILVMIMPGVLTIPWEAPHSLRSIGVIPAVIALITLAIGFIWQLGRSARIAAVRVGTVVVVVGLLGFIAYDNIDAYFGEQANNSDVYTAFSTTDTLMTRDVSDQAARGYVPMFSRQLRHSLVANTLGLPVPPQTIAAPVNIPIDPALVWHGAAVYLEPRESGFYDTLKVYYPAAKFHEARPPMGGDVMYYSAYISRKRLESAQGFLSRITLPNGEVIESVKTTTESVWALEDVPENAPFDVEWRGVLHIKEPGEYTFALQSDSDAEVLLDGRVVLTDDKPVARIEPAVGLHTIEVRSQVERAEGVLRLLWQRPSDMNEDVDEHLLEPVEIGNLYHGDVRPVGLAGRFFKGVKDIAEIEGAAPDAMRITPAVGSAFWYDSVVEGYHLAVWDGSIDLPSSGLYRFKFGEVHGDMRVVIDGKSVIDTRKNREGELKLEAGVRQIRLEYFTSAGSPWFEIFWTPPEQPEERIAPDYLAPAPEYMFRVVGEG